MENIPQVANGSVSFIIVQQQQQPVAGQAVQPVAGGIPGTTALLLSSPRSLQHHQQHHQHQQPPLLPKPAQKAVVSTRTPPLKPAKRLRSEAEEILRCKRRLDFARLGLQLQQPCPAAVSRRNERERRRVKQINHTFVHLRDHLPALYWGDKNPSKVSKVDTLRAAIDYINNLQDLLQTHDTSATPASQPPAVATTSPVPSTSPPLSPEEEELLDFASWFQ